MGALKKYLTSIVYDLSFLFKHILHLIRFITKNNLPWQPSVSLPAPQRYLQHDRLEREYQIRLQFALARLEIQVASFRRSVSWFPCRYQSFFFSFFLPLLPTPWSPYRLYLFKGHVNLSTNHDLSSFVIGKWSWPSSIPTFDFWGRRVKE